MAIEYETLEEEKVVITSTETSDGSPSFDNYNLDSSLDSTTAPPPPPPPPAPVANTIFTFQNPQKNSTNTELLQSSVNVLQLQQPYSDYCHVLENAIITSNRTKSNNNNNNNRKYHNSNSSKSKKTIPLEKYYNPTKKLIVVRKLRIITFHADCTNNNANIHSSVDVDVILSLMTRHLLQNSIFSSTINTNTSSFYTNTQSKTNSTATATNTSTTSSNNSIYNNNTTNIPSRHPSVLALSLPSILPLDQFLKMKKVQYVIEWTTTIIYFFIKDKLFYAKLAAVDNAITPKSTCYTPRSVSIVINNIYLLYYYYSFTIFLSHY